MKAVTMVFLEGVDRFSATGGTVCSLGVACRTVVGVGKGGSCAVGGTKSLCAPHANIDDIKPRVDSSDTEETLNHTLRAELHVTAAPDGTWGKDNKG